MQDQVKAAGGKVYGVEGEQTGEWLLVDTGETVIHIMQPAIRSYYNLEELWAPPPKSPKSTRVKQETKEKAAKSAAPRKPAASRSKTKRVLAA